jgi:hypothetical protein
MRIPVFISGFILLLTTASAAKAPHPIWWERCDVPERRIVFVAQAVGETVNSIARPDSLRPTEWRRTSDGWQPLEQLMARRPQESWTAASHLHPLVVGSFLVLASLGALLFFEEDRTLEFIQSED